MLKNNTRFFVLIFMLLASGCVSRLPIAPIKVPVSLAKTGTIVDMDFKVRRAYEYGFLFDFFIRKNCKDAIFSTEANELGRFLGHSFVFGGRGVKKNVAVPILVRLTITSLSDNQIIYQEAIIPHLGTWGSCSVSNWLGYSKKLEKGNYHVVLENMTNATEFNNYPVFFLMREQWFK